jgi:spore coat polysaccharide biosynthesis protein SpsF
VHPVAIIQARMGSTRLPGKVLLPLAGRPMLWQIVRRLQWAESPCHIVVATSDLAQDEPIRAMCEGHGIDCFAGSEHDVLDRFYRAAVRSQGDPLIRITADCPFVDPQLVDRLVSFYVAGAFTHAAVATGAGALYLEGGRFPDGLDAECFSFSALETAWREAADPVEREHVTPYIWRNKERFRCGLMTSDVDCSEMRWTVDNQEDFDVAADVYRTLYAEDRPFLMPDILAYFSSHPDIAARNRAFVGKEGYRELWKSGN